MRGVAWCAVAAISAAGPALASDKLAIAPPPAWVVPVAVPADDGKASDAPVKLLLRDEQDDLHPGRITRYVESAFKVQTPQGLPAGAVTLAWDPAIESATVHRLLIRRGAQVIDVLKTQSFTVLRRETNLEKAMLDGQLTASIQPEGLQVGDVVDFAVSVTNSDPAVATHVEQVGAMWNGVPVARAHLRAQWPADVAMRLQPAGGIVPPKVTRNGGLASIDIAMDDVQPLALPKGAPSRYQYGRLIELTDAASWDRIVALMAPLYAKAEALRAGGALEGEIARIRAASPDPKARAEAALALVQDRVRYVFLGMNDGGLVPADAEQTWSRRFGDCKGKTVLLLALLHALGIDAQPVLVSTVFGDGLPQRLPAIGLFDHVLVRARIGGRDYWLDGTRVGDTAIDAIETPDLHWGLPLEPGKAALVAMLPPPSATPRTEVAIRIDASAGLAPPAPIHIVRTVRGDEAVGTNLALANLVGDARDRALREFFKQRYDFAEPRTVTTRFDPVRRELEFVMDGTTRMDWNEGWYEADHVWVGYKADFSRDAGPDRDAPYAVPYPNYTRVTETILLPPKAGTFTITPGSDVDQIVAGQEYHRHARIEGDRFIVEESDRSLAPEFPAAQAPAAEETLRALAKKSVFLNRPANYTERGAPIVVKAATPSGGGSALVGRGNALLENHDFTGAIDLFTKAIAIEPRNAMAFADRGIARVQVDEEAAGAADLDAAQALDPRNAVVFRARGLIAQKKRQYEEAIGFFTIALAIEPDSLFARYHRAESYYGARKDDLALGDASTIIQGMPSNFDMYVLRADVFLRKGDRIAVAHEADQMLAANPKSSDAMVAAAKIYSFVNREVDAMRLLAAALAIKPESYIYLIRAEIRPKTDVAGRQSDIDAALKLDPDAPDVVAAKADLQAERRDWRGEVATLGASLAKKPGDVGFLSRRGVAYLKTGQNSLSDKDFIAARAAATTPAALNDLCWTKAIAGVALDRALGECDAALALSPDAADILDSRAFVLLRLGRTDDAIAEYGRALAVAPGMSASLYGRALAEARKGDKAAADRDAAAALKADPGVRDEFDGYGVTMPPPPAALAAGKVGR